MWLQCHCALNGWVISGQVLAHLLSCEEHGQVCWAVLELVMGFAPPIVVYTWCCLPAGDG
jgi:hypothetical protein